MKNITRILSAALALCLLAALCLPARADGTQDCGAKLLAITFDDGPGKYTGALLDGLAETVGKREQAILFLNRRGYNASISCRSCGQPLTCPKCSVAMTYHKTRSHWLNDPRLVCHWCGTELPLPRACPSCGSEHLAPVGFGTERIEEELKLRIPDARILRMDADTTLSLIHI